MIHVLHKWSDWGEMYQTTFSNKLGWEAPGMVQTKRCTVCGKYKWRQV